MTDDRDPTGMRHLLAGLKESGPMPDDLSDRIRASLDRERDGRSGPDDEGAFWSEMDSEQRGAGRRRHPAGRWVLGIAAAAVLALGVWGIFALGSDESEDASGPGTSASTNEGGGSPASSSDGSESSGTPSKVPAFAITHTETDYSRATMQEKAAELEADPAGAPELKDPGLLEGMDTAAAASDCLARLGQPDLLPIVIDVATFDGKEGLLLLAEEAPEGKVRAWAVTPGCEPIWKESFPIREE